MQASAVKYALGFAAHFSRIAFRASRYSCVRCANRLSSALLSALGRRPAVSAAAAAGSPTCEPRHWAVLRPKAMLQLDGGSACAPAWAPGQSAAHLLGADARIAPVAVDAAPGPQAILPRCVHHPVQPRGQSRAQRMVPSVYRPSHLAVLVKYVPDPTLCRMPQRGALPMLTPPAH
jgi:hypothetical protein